jgi:hypothetical protein
MVPGNPTLLFYMRKKTALSAANLEGITTVFWSLPWAKSIDNPEPLLKLFSITMIP